jgi:acyl carrier protein
MATETFTDTDVRDLLVAVGCGSAGAADTYGTSFEELELDSLARMEMASRIKSRFGIEVEDDLGPELTPTGMRHLINERLAGVEV